MFQMDYLISLGLFYALHSAIPQEPAFGRPYHCSGHHFHRTDLLASASVTLDTPYAASLIWTTLNFTL